MLSEVKMIKRKIALLLSLLLLFGALASCINKPEPDPSPSPATAAPTASSGQDANNEDNEQFERISKEMFISVATSDGFTYHQFIKDPAFYGINEADVERGWGSISLEAHEADHRDNDEILQRLAAIDRSNLTPMNATAYDTIVETLELANASRDYFYYSEPLETLNGNHTMLPLMMTMYEIEDKSDLDGYMYLLEDMPRYIGEIAEFEKQKAEKGLFMSENALETVLASIDTFIESGENCFLIGFIDDVLKDGVDGMDKDTAAEFSEANRNCVLERILPAYSELRSTLSGLKAKCGRFVGAAERGEEAKRYFVSSIKSSAACDMEPEDMAELLDETASTLVTKLMQIIYSDRDAMSSFGSKITSGDPDTDIEYLLELIKDIYPTIPEQQIEYIEVPDAVAEDFSPAAYLLSAFDDPSRNIVITNPTADTNTLLLTMAHECFPGHLYQTQYFRNGGFPLAQQIAAPSGYSEGWAVFSELMIASKAERYGANACLIDRYNSFACNIIIPAYISLRVNYNGWDKQRIGEYLESYGLNQSEYINIIYEYAVNMPDYFFNYGMGFANTYRIYQKVNPKTDAELLAFFKEYLDLGPCCYDVLFKHFGITA